ncbi:MAG: hypothetical protein JO197_15240 [Acidobacteria bacterium]|nr:hypothetical protein [Acidobacteriota bacterium]MBV9475123.1 hypothetical protein [Acidobacteriota bacterium]
MQSSRAVPSARNVIALALFALALHAVYFVESNRDFFYPDSATYLAPANGLLHGRGFTTDGQAETMRTPGYPCMLVPFLALHLGAGAIVAFQHLLVVLLALAVYVFAFRRIGARALLAALFVACDVPTIHHANKVLTEVPFTVLLFIAFVLLVERRAWKTCALLCGVLVLVRPVAIAYVVVIAIVAAVARVPRRKLAAIVALALVLPLAWAARNAAHTGVFTVASIAGTNMLMYRAAGALAIFDDDEFDDALRDRQEELEELAQNEIEAKFHADPGDLPHAVMAREYSRIGRRIVLQHPLGFALSTLRGAEVVLFDSDHDAIMTVSAVPSTILNPLLDALTIALLVFAVIGTCALWNRDRALALPLVLTIVYFVAISAGAEAEARFRVPVVPQFAIAAAAGLAAVRRAMRSTAS